MQAELLGFRHGVIYHKTTNCISINLLALIKHKNYLILNMTREVDAALAVASTFHRGSTFHTMVMFLFECFACPILYHRREDFRVRQSYIVRRHLHTQNKHVNETRCVHQVNNTEMKLPACTATAA
jgi:hypothetical protein